MRKYKLVLPESIAKEKERQKELKRRKAAREAAKRKEARKREAERRKAREKAEKEKAKALEKEKAEKEKAREIRRAEQAAKKYQKKLIYMKERYRKYVEAHKDEIEARRKEREAAKAEAKLVRLAEKNAQKVRETEAKRLEKEKAEKEKEAVRLRSERNKKYLRQVMKKKRKSEANRRYYDSHGRLEKMKPHIESNDVPGRYIIAVAQDSKVQCSKYKKRWRNEAFDKYNELVEKNHSEVMCPAEEITSTRKATCKTVRELLLLRHVNPDIEGNESSFRDEYGKNVTVRTDDAEWVVERREPWYVDEKFIVPNLNPTSSKKTMGWICENFIDNGLSEDNLKKVFIWGNYVVIDGDDGFEFAIGRTVRAAVNLYLALFKKYDGTDYIYFIGELDSSLAGKWMEKIREKTGWKNLVKGKRTYYKKASADEEEITKSMPTSSKSTASTRGKSSGGKA